MVAKLLLAGLGLISQAAVSQPGPKVDLRCGAYCLYISMKALDLPVGEYKDFEVKLGQPSSMGYSMRQLAETASSYGAHTLGVETSLDQLERRRGRFACIALLEGAGHFVCINDIDASGVQLIDPPDERVVSRDAFAGLWKGKALLIADHPLEASVSARYPAWIIPSAVTVIAAALLIVRMARLRRSG